MNNTQGIDADAFFVFHAELTLAMGLADARKEADAPVGARISSFPKKFSCSRFALAIVILIPLEKFAESSARCVGGTDQWKGIFASAEN